MSDYLYLIIPVAGVGLVYLVRKLREWQWGWARNPQRSLQGKVFIVTGANIGLGFETTKALLRRNATVIMACRSVDRATAAAMTIRKTVPEGTFTIIHLDLSSFKSIRDFVATIHSEYPRFDCLINNAGMAVKEPQLTDEGFELHFGVNHLGHFLLQQLLSPAIQKNKARIVVVSSLMHVRATVDFEQLGKVVEGLRVRGNNPYYNNSKLCNFYHARELYKRGFDAHVLCPGLCHTDFFRDYNPRWYHYLLFAPVVWLMLRSAEQGAQNIIHAATDAENSAEKNPATNYLIRNVQQVKSKHAFDEAVSVRLWDESLKMCRLPAEEAVEEEQQQQQRN